MNRTSEVSIRKRIGSEVTIHGRTRAIKRLRISIIRNGATVELTYPQVALSGHQHLSAAAPLRDQGSMNSVQLLDTGSYINPANQVTRIVD